MYDFPGVLTILVDNTKILNFRVPRKSLKLDLLATAFDIVEHSSEYFYFIIQQFLILYPYSIDCNHLY